MLNFQEIIGHEQIKEHFQKAIEYNKVSHAYILTGEAGMGRKSLAHLRFCVRGERVSPAWSAMPADRF